MSVEEGQALPGLRRTITSDDVRAYAEASADFNPLHLDEAFAKQTPFGGTIVHGMHLLALLNEMLTAAFGERWPATGRLKVRFRAPARPGAVVLGSGIVTKVENDRVSATVELKDEAGELLVGGDASVEL